MCSVYQYLGRSRIEGYVGYHNNVKVLFMIQSIRFGRVKLWWLEGLADHVEFPNWAICSTFLFGS